MGWGEQEGSGSGEYILHVAGGGSIRQTVIARLQNDPQLPLLPGIHVLMKSLPTRNSADLCYQ